MAVLEYIQQKKMLESVKNGVLRKFPLVGATMANLIFEPNQDIKTAGTDGTKVVYSPKFMESLTYDERVCLISHEIMHDAFDHIRRSKGKNPELWNIATDAVINQMLKAANLPLPKGGIDMPEAQGKSAEEMYEILQEKKKQQQNQQGQIGGNNADQQQERDQNKQQNNLGQGAGQHNMWRKAMSLAENKKQEQNGREWTQHSSVSSDMEKKFTKANENLKQQMGEQIREKLRKQKEEIIKKCEGGGQTYEFNDVGETTAVLSWKKILKRELAKEEDRWTYRRANEDNDYQARIGTLEVEDRPETEVMLDVSGSISDNFLKGFLRQLKPLLNESKLRVGCFDEFVYEFVEIKSVKDIDHFKVTRKSAWTEDWDAAVRAFSKKKGINKIIFTDGNPCPGVMPKEDLSKVNVIWLVFDNQRFKPCCGKVIFVNKQELDYMTKNDDVELTK